jgi:magnesium chelatase family protein
MLRDKVIERIARQIAKHGKHTLLVGSPGTGKTRIALKAREYLGPPKEIRLLGKIREVYRAAGLNQPDSLERPFRAPHHTVSRGAMLGRRPDPDTAFPYYGELSLAHGGVLFLDELPEFHGSVLEDLQPALVAKAVTHGTRTGNVTYPADFLLLAGMNHCPCGWRGYPGETKCVCTPEAVERYMSRLKTRKGSWACSLYDMFEVFDLNEELNE